MYSMRDQSGYVSVINAIFYLFFSVLYYCSVLIRLTRRRMIEEF